MADIDMRVDEAATMRLRQEDGFRGELIGRGSVAYDEARHVWNGSIDRSPALVARCHGTADVVAAVRFARAEDLEIAVRGAGTACPASPPVTAASSSI
jgi:hypothetical protein